MYNQEDMKFGNTWKGVSQAFKENTLLNSSQFLFWSFGSKKLTDKSWDKLQMYILYQCAYAYTHTCLHATSRQCRSVSRAAPAQPCRPCWLLRTADWWHAGMCVYVWFCVYNMVYYACIVWCIMLVYYVYYACIIHVLCVYDMVYCACVIWGTMRS